jgi:hypothetical protein
MEDAAMRTLFVALAVAAGLAACTDPNAPHDRQTAAAMPDTSQRDQGAAPDAGQTGQVAPPK